MLNVAKQGGYEIVVASRNADGGSMGSFGSRRIWLSNLGRRLSSAMLRADLTDPMSGYFLVSRKYVDEVVHDVSVLGFKILLDLIASSRRAVRIAEVPYEFRMREHGSSKLEASVGIDFLLLLADKLAGDIIPVRFGVYALVGLSGIAVHVAVFAATHAYAPELGILAAQSIATTAAIVSNFFLNNHITFRDRRLRGWRSICVGLFWYLIVCSVGAFVNLATTRFLVDVGTSWLMAGAAGMCFSAVWNFAAATLLLWMIERRRARRTHRSHAEAALQARSTS
jgi:dolichol-phosphate mannosyltransferase